MSRPSTVSLSLASGPWLRLPGGGFSIWTLGQDKTNDRSPVREVALQMGRGFCLPLSGNDVSAAAAPMQKRGFVKKKVRRVLSSRPPEPDPARQNRADDALPLAASTVFSKPPTVHSAISSDPHPMTAPSSTKLPGNAFSIWTQNPPESLAIQLAAAADAPPTPVAASPFQARDPEEEPRVIVKKRSPFLQWVAILLFFSALAAYLATESERRELDTQKAQLENENVQLTREKQGFHDNWKEEESLRKDREVTIAEKEAAIDTLGNELRQSKNMVMQLTAEKNGLSETIKDLRGSLAMAIEDHKNTEASLRKVINGLEDKNLTITKNLAAEQGKLRDVEERLTAVMSELAQANETNRQLGEENGALQSKVAQLQSDLQKSIDGAQAKEETLRQEIAQLQTSNHELQSSLDTQKKELADVKEKLRLSEDQAVEEKESRLEIQNLASQLEEVIQVRDRLEEDKGILAQSVVDLQKELELVLTEQQESGDPAKFAALESAKSELLERNSQLQKVVDQLNADLSKASESGQSRESELATQIQALTESNAELKSSLEKQRDEFNALLRQASRGSDEDDGEVLTAPAPTTSAVHPENVEELQAAVETLTRTLNVSLENQPSARGLPETLAAQTEEMLQLNTRLAQAAQELQQAQAVMGEVETLRDEVALLREQGQSLQRELAQRTVRIHTLSDDHTERVAEVLELRQLLESEQRAQKMLKELVDSLQSKIGELQPQATNESLASTEEP